jgi:predicted dinucleotide-binding enzyme
VTLEIIMNRGLIFLLVSLVGLHCFSAPSLSDESSAIRKEVIAILGTGDMGDSFGPRLADLGYKIVYGSRSPDSDKVIALLESTGNGASATTADRAAQQAEIVFLALPWGPMEQIIKSLGDMEGKTIIDLSWPENEFGEDGYFQITADPSGAEIIQSWIPKAMVVKAFGTTGTNVIDDPNDAGGPVTIPIASDHRHAKEVTARLAAELGLDPVDAGPLRMARNIEAMMALYMVPLTQGRGAGWEFYFRRTNFWPCNEYTGGEEVDAGIPTSDAGNLAEFPETQGVPEPCPQ